MNKFIVTTFWVLIGVFLVVLAEFFIPAVRDLFRGSILFLAPLAVFFLLGSVLLFLAIKGSVKGMLKKFLILTGASAAGFFVFVLLHNAVYGLFGVEEPFFFILAVIVCPLGFLIGATGSIVLFIKKRGGE